METNIGVKMVVSARTAASLFLRSGMFIVNFVIITKFPLVLCVLKTVKMICNSNVYLTNKYNFVSTHLFWGRHWNSQQRISWSMIYGLVGLTIYCNCDKRNVYIQSNTFKGPYNLIQCGIKWSTSSYLWNVCTCKFSCTALLFFFEVPNY
jgi:hypothetical protein